MITLDELTPEQWARLSKLRRELVGSQPQLFTPEAATTIPFISREERKATHDPAEIEAHAFLGLLEVMSDLDEDRELRNEAASLLRERDWPEGLPTWDLEDIVPALVECLRVEDQDVRRVAARALGSIGRAAPGNLGRVDFLVGTPTLAAAAATRKHTSLGDSDLTVSCEEDADQTLTFTIRLRGQPGGAEVELTVGSTPRLVVLRDDPFDMGAWGVLAIKADDWRNLPDGPTLGEKVVCTPPSGEPREYRLRPQPESVD